MVVAFGLLISLATALIVGLFRGGRRPLKNRAALFAVVFLSVWFFGLWMAPFGPNWGGVYWLPFLFSAIVVALIVMSMSPPPPLNAEEEKQEEREEVESAEGIGIFFWILAGIEIVLIFLKFTGNWLPAIH